MKKQRKRSCQDCKVSWGRAEPASPFQLQHFRFHLNPHSGMSNPALEAYVLLLLTRIFPCWSDPCFFSQLPWPSFMSFLASFYSRIFSASARAGLVLQWRVGPSCRSSVKKTKGRWGKVRENVWIPPDPLVSNRHDVARVMWELMPSTYIKLNLFILLILPPPFLP